MNSRWMAVLRLHMRISYVVTFIQGMNISNTELFDSQALFLLSCRQHVDVLTSGLWYIMALVMWLPACISCHLSSLLGHFNNETLPWAKSVDEIVGIAVVWLRLIIHWADH